MDIEKLIKRLKRPQIQSCPMDGEYPSCKVCQKDLRQEVITEFSTLQAENEKLRAELEYEKEHANAYYEECGQWEAENEKLRAEVESLKKGYCAGCSIPAVKAEQIRDLTDAPQTAGRAGAGDAGKQRSLDVH